jgi:hypothetical protein
MFNYGAEFRMASERRKEIVDYPIDLWLVIMFLAFLEQNNDSRVLANLEFYIE